LLGLLYHVAGVHSPFQLLGDVDSEKLKTVDPLHSDPVDVDGIMLRSSLPVVDDQLLGLVDIESEVVFLAPVR